MTFTPDVISAVRDPRVPVEQRRRAVAAAVKDEPKALRAVLDLMLERDRIALLPSVATAFADLVDRREGVVKGKVTTSTALDRSQQGGVVRRLEEASGKKIRATFAVDARLIGGA